MPLDAVEWLLYEWKVSLCQSTLPSDIVTSVVALSTVNVYAFYQGQSLQVYFSIDEHRWYLLATCTASRLNIINRTTSSQCTN